jgi:hypothetical protein
MAKNWSQAAEVLDYCGAAMVGHTATKRAQWQIEHEVRKYKLALASFREGIGDTVHGGFGRKSAKILKSELRRSNRDQTDTPNSASKSVTYDALM